MGGPIHGAGTFAVAIVARGSAAPTERPLDSRTETGTVTSPPMDWCQLREVLYTVFSRNCWQAQNDTLHGLLQQHTANATAHESGLPASSSDGCALVATLLVGAGLFVLPLTPSSSSLTSVAVTTFAVLSGALAAVTWLRGGGDDFILNGEGLLEQSAGAQPSDPCLYGVGLITMSGALLGIMTRHAE